MHYNPTYNYMEKNDLINRLQTLIKSIAFSEEAIVEKCIVCKNENCQCANIEMAEVAEVAPVGEAEAEQTINPDNSGVAPEIKEIQLVGGENYKYNTETGEMWSETETGDKFPIPVGIYETNEGVEIMVVDEGIATMKEKAAEETVEETVVAPEEVAMSVEKTEMEILMSRVEKLENMNSTLEKLVSNFEKINDLVVEMSAQPIAKPIDLKNIANDKAETFIEKNLRMAGKMPKF